MAELQAQKERDIAMQETQRAKYEKEKSEIESKVKIAEAEQKAEEERTKQKEYEAEKARAEESIQKEKTKQKEWEAKIEQSKGERSLQAIKEGTKVKELETKKAEFDQKRAEIVRKEKAEQWEAQKSQAEAQKKQADATSKAIEEYRTLRAQGEGGQVAVLTQMLSSVSHSFIHPGPRVENPRRQSNPAIGETERRRNWTAPQVIPDIPEGV